ncbi:MAG: crossover junction endodeoxyribonuclease RuvC [Rhodomicrobium sp.]|nr:crossover junction endodeoxyribonuclease RuvC [Rhodomicrobium sp.]
MTVRIIGIDPGLRRMGWGVIETSGTRLAYLASGTVTSDAAAALCDRLAGLFAGLEAILTDWRPHEAAVEETFVNRDAHATLKLGQARGIALLAPARAGIAVAEYPPNLVKKTVTGSGHAEKKQIRAMIGYLLPKAKPDSDDAADALAIAIAHAHHRQAAALRHAVLAAQLSASQKRHSVA